MKALNGTRRWTRLAGLPIARQLRPFTVLALVGGLGVLACSKVLGADFDAAPEEKVSTSGAGGSTSASDTDGPTLTTTTTSREDGGSNSDPTGGLDGTGGRPPMDSDVTTDSGGSGGAPEVDADSNSNTSLAGSGGEAGAPTTEGSGGEGGEAGAAARCNATAPFTTVRKVNGINGAAALAHYSFDELTVYYNDGTDPQLRILRATRPSRDEAFGPAEPVTPLNALGGMVANPSLTADGLTAYLESNATGLWRIYVASRDTQQQDFPEPSVVSEIIADAGQEGGNFISTDGAELYFHSARHGTNDLFRAPLSAFGFQDVEALLVSSDEYHESFPALSPDGLALYFLREAVSAPGSNTTIWRAVRADASEAFTDPQPVTELDSPDAPIAEIPDWISTDNCRFYFSRMPVGTLWPGSSLFVATRAPEEP